MFRRIHFLTAAAGICLFASAVPADEQVPELLPPPRVVRVFDPTPCAVPLDPMYLRTNRYDVWQNYAVDRSGMFRARVIEGPAGAYYRYSGESYPWATVHPTRRNAVVTP